MSFTKMKLMLAAVAVAGLVACDPTEPAPATCTSNADCDAATEICHPDVKQCVQTCELAADCPSSSRLCEALGGTSADKDKKICKCSTSEICAADGSQVCNDTYKLCEPKCTVNTDCATGFACNTTSGQCERGTNPTACTPGSCSANQVCNLTTGTCQAAATCTGSSQSTCSYGQFCNSGSCKDAPLASTTCENFSGSNRPPFNSSSNGPVIYEVTRKEYQVNSAYCAGSAPDAFIVTVKAYRPDSNWPNTRSEVAGFFYVRTDTTQLDIVTSGLLVPNTGYNRNVNNLKDAEFNVYLCRPSSSQTLQVGFYFTGGNPVCANLNR